MRIELDENYLIWILLFFNIFITFIILIILSLLLIKIQGLHRIHNKYYELIEYGNTFLDYFTNQKKYNLEKKLEKGKLEEGFINFN